MIYANKILDLFERNFGDRTYFNDLQLNRRLTAQMQEIKITNSWKKEEIQAIIKVLNRHGFKTPLTEPLLNEIRYELTQIGKNKSCLEIEKKVENIRG